MDQNDALHDATVYGDNESPVTDPENTATSWPPADASGIPLLGTWPMHMANVGGGLVMRNRSTGVWRPLRGEPVQMPPLDSELGAAPEATAQGLLDAGLSQVVRNGMHAARLQRWYGGGHVPPATTAVHFLRVSGTPRPVQHQGDDGAPESSPERVPPELLPGIPYPVGATRVLTSSVVITTTTTVYRVVQRRQGGAVQYPLGALFYPAGPGFRGLPEGVLPALPAPDAPVDHLPPVVEQDVGQIYRALPAPDASAEEESAEEIDDRPQEDR